ncbi:MAG: hypothetical protein VXY28_08495 [Bacteroidota bacterium]|nr:hypothetical protein [Bacteroidota bacterium]
MSKDQKETKEIPITENNKSLKIIVLVLLVTVTALAAAYFLMNDSEKVVKQEPVLVVQEEAEVTDTIEVVQEDTTIMEAEVEEVVEEIQDQPVSKPKKKRIDYNNSAKYWKISLVNNQDTSYYVIKNRVSGLTLSNRYYSKSEAEKELQNFKKIIQ